MPGTSRQLLAYFTETTTGFFIITGHAGNVSTSTGLLYWKHFRLFHRYWPCRERLDNYLPTLLKPPVSHAGNVSTSTCLFYWNNHRLFHYWSWRERLDIYLPILLKQPPVFSSLLVMPGTSRHLLAYFTETTTGFVMPTLLKPPVSHAGNVSTSTCLLHWTHHRLFHHYWSWRERLDIYLPTLLKQPSTFSSFLASSGTSRHLLVYFTKTTTGFFIITGHAGNVSTSTGLFYWTHHRLFHHYWSCRERLDIYLPTSLNPPPAFSCLLYWNHRLLIYWSRRVRLYIYLPTSLKPPAFTVWQLLAFFLTGTFLNMYLLDLYLSTYFRYSCVNQRLLNYWSLELELELIQTQITNPNDTEANAAGRSVRACVALEVLLDYVVLAYSTGTTGFFITGHSRYCLTRFCLLDLSCTLPTWLALAYFTGFFITGQPSRDSNIPRHR